MTNRTELLLLALAAAIALAARPARAAGDAGTSAVPFLQMQHGARPTGMGGAFTAIADDANAIWWNPAGLARSNKTQATFSHTSFVEDIKTQYIAVGRPIPALKGSVGASFTYLSVPGIEGYDSLGRSVGNITANSYAASLAYATWLVPETVTVGVNGKMIGQKLETQTGSGFAMDAGVQYKKDRLGAGAAVQHVGPSFKMGADTSPLPLTFRAGLSYDLYPKVTAALDLEKSRESNVRPLLGGEVRLTSNFHLRAGYQKQENTGSGSGLSFGFSLIGNLGRGSGDGWAGDGTPWWERGAGSGGWLASLDYSFLSFGDLKDVHRISLGFKF